MERNRPANRRVGLSQGGGSESSGNDSPHRGASAADLADMNRSPSLLLKAAARRLYAEQQGVNGQCSTLVSPAALGCHISCSASLQFDLSMNGRSLLLLGCHFGHRHHHHVLLLPLVASCLQNHSLQQARATMELTQHRKRDGRRHGEKLQQPAQMASFPGSNSIGKRSSRNSSSSNMRPQQAALTATVLRIEWLCSGCEMHALQTEQWP